MPCFELFRPVAIKRYFLLTTFAFAPKSATLSLYQVKVFSVYKKGKSSFEFPITGFQKRALGLTARTTQFYPQLKIRPSKKNILRSSLKTNIYLCIYLYCDWSFLFTPFLYPLVIVTRRAGIEKLKDQRISTFCVSVGYEDYSKSFSYFPTLSFPTRKLELSTKT